MNSTLIATIACLWAVAAPAQQSEGFFAGVPTALSVAKGTAANQLHPYAMHLKPAGFRQKPPVAWPQNLPSNAPSFAIERALQSTACCSGRNLDIDIDAMSIGEDWILADCSGRISIPPGVPRWVVMTFSVTPGTRGKPGSAIAAEQNGRGGDVFSYTLVGSDVPTPTGLAQRAQDSAEIDLGDNELDALDHFIPIYTLDQCMVDRLPTGPPFFFSVSHRSRSQVPACWWTIPGTPATLPSGATILMMTWTPSPFGSGGTWSCPRPYLTYGQLGLTQDDDVDALAVDLLNGRILFSTATGKPDPIMYLDLGCDFPAASPYSDPNGNPVSGKIGLLSDDDVDAICHMDPSFPRRGGRVNPMLDYIGTPKDPCFFPPGQMLTASVFRTYDLTLRKTSYHVSLVGWPMMTGAVPGVCAASVSFDRCSDMFPLFVNPNRDPNNPSNPFAGYPQEFDVPVAQCFYGVPLYFRGLAADAAITDIAEAWPLVIRL